MKSTVYPDHPAPVLALRTVTYFELFSLLPQ